MIDTAFREPIERVLGWMQALRTPQGVMLCPEHRIEHTGKNAGLVVMACELVRLGVGDHEELYTLALEQALRIAGRLDREGNSTCWTFRPGRHDPYNCSNNVIDGGACSDALGTFLETFDERLSPGVRNILERACVLHAQTYLRYAAFDKGIAAQRAWALTGVAQAWKRSGHGVLEYATLEGVKALFEAMHPDGSYAYHAPDGGPAHPGAADVSAFYQSRIAAFSMFSLEAVGQDLRDPRWREPLQKQLAFLAALYGPDGIKVGSIEAKPWYHGAHYEVASHPFDVYALARGARLFEDASLGRVALAAWRAWVAHLTPEGRPQDHLPGPGRQRSYQCPTFWAGHTMWMARALEDLHWLEFEDGPAKASAPEVPRVEGFAQAGLVRLENAHWVAWVRGAHPPSNWMHGSPVGAGLLRIFDKERGRDHLVCDSEATRADGHWVGTHGRWPRLRAAWRKNRHELRFSWWLARNAFRRAGLLAALREPLRAVRVGIWGFASNQTRSAWCVDPALERMPDGVRLEGRMVWHDGTRAGSAVLVRTYRIDAEHLAVHGQRVVVAV
ncbi:MAG TPA: hypothetical protein PLJ12_03975, partial [Planctomycetota bacterium]|nr:hypothetical protein [Planctomycetota bacterium]